MDGWMDGRTRYYWLIKKSEGEMEGRGMEKEDGEWNAKGWGN